MGYVRTFPRDIVYAPKELMGIGIMHPWFHQELTHIETCLQEDIAKTITGDLLRASSEQMKLEIGLSSHIGEVTSETKKALSLATDCWLKTVHDFASHHGLRLEDTTPNLVPRRDEDKFLMEEFIRFGYQGADLRMLNECRMFLKTVCLSELVTADGERIDEWAWKGTKKEQSLNQYQWPRIQTRLSNGHWALWRQGLQRCFLQNPSEDRKLRTRVGKIKLSLRPQWRWFYSEQEARLFHREGGRWAVYSKTPSRVRRLRSLKFIKQFQFVDALPAESQPASVQRAPKRMRITGLGGFADPIPTPDHPTTIDDALLTRPTGDRWAVDVLDNNDNGRSVARAILKGTARAISDGSFKDQLGTSSTVIYGDDEINRMISVNAVPGHIQEQSAYRSELAGIEGALAILESVCQVHDIQHGAVTIGLDGEQALIEASGDWPLNPSRADFDMLTDIRAKIKRLPITVQWRWIKGHQDDEVSYDDLDDWAKANVLVDNVAKAYWNRVASTASEPQAHRFGDEAWALYVNKMKVGKFDKQRLYTSFREEKIMEYWASKSERHREAIRDVDWAVCGAAFKSLTISQQRKVTKHAAGHMACGKMMKLWSFQDHEECPRCPAVQETPRHVLACPAPSTSVIWSKSLTKLQSWMESTHTMPELQTAVITRLRQWKGETNEDPLLPEHCGLRSAVLHQDELGWYNFLMGRISLQWQEVQQHYYEWLGRRNTGRKWTTALIKKVWEVSWDMWDHRNEVRVNTLTPAKRRRLVALNLLVTDEYQRGTEGMRPKDHHWLSKPPATILQYDFHRKEQWAESIQLARLRFDNHLEHEADANRRQRELFADWMTVRTG
jgi:hypothetical protein